MKPLLIACDFDGTVTQRDTLHVIVERFGEPGRWERFEPDLRAGRITLETAMEGEFAAVRATPEEVHATVAAQAPLREGFVEFVAWAEARGHRLVVSSNGFRAVIEPVLAAAGVAHLEIVANDAVFTTRGTTIRWDDRGARCVMCDRPCKRAPLAARLDPGQPLVLIGDGISDRCAAGMADHVFARDGLVEHLRATGIPFAPFETFHDVRAGLERLREAA